MQKHVILVGNEDLLRRAVELFLSNQEDWLVTKITHTNSTSKFLNEVGQIHPDVVIFCKSDCHETTSLPFQLMKKYPRLKVITVNHHDNSVEVYKKHKVCLNEISDLLEIVAS